MVKLFIQENKDTLHPFLLTKIGNFYLKTALKFFKVASLLEMLDWNGHCFIQYNVSLTSKNLAKQNTIKI